MYADAAAYKNMRVSVWSANMELNSSGSKSTSLAATVVAILTATIVCLLLIFCQNLPQECMRVVETSVEEKAWLTILLLK